MNTQINAYLRFDDLGSNVISPGIISTRRRASKPSMSTPSHDHKLSAVIERGTVRNGARLSARARLIHRDRMEKQPGGQQHRREH